MTSYVEEIDLFRQHFTESGEVVSGKEKQVFALKLGIGGWHWEERLVFPVPVEFNDLQLVRLFEIMDECKSKIFAVAELESP